jgi:hypothetical protein
MLRVGEPGDRQAVRGECGRSGGRHSRKTCQDLPVGVGEQDRDLLLDRSAR